MSLTIDMHFNYQLVGRTNTNLLPTAQMCVCVCMCVRVYVHVCVHVCTVIVELHENVCDYLLRPMMTTLT